MNVSEPFIRRPIATTLIMTAVLLFGWLAYTRLPVSDLPNVDFPTLLVTAALPGASPETMASSVATPLERQFSSIAGVSSMSSSSSLGATRITLQFDLSRELDGAAQDVQAAITAAAGQLPTDLPTPPSFRKVNPADQPILYFALTTPTLPLHELDRYAEELIAQRLSMLAGVAQVQVFGAQKFAVRVQLDPRALAQRGLGIDEVQAAIAAANPNLPTGSLQGSSWSWTLRANGQLPRAAAWEKLVVAQQGNAPVHLSDLGRVIDSVENDQVGAWYRDAPSVVLAVQRQPGSNTVDVARRVRAVFPRLAEALPKSVSIHVLFDRSVSIDESVSDVKFTLVLTLILVVGVIFLFLRTIRATAIPAVALPLSLLGTAAVMWLLDFSLDNLSLLALTLSVGFVVDDAIVMLENVVRHVEAGEGPLDAALNGSREIGFTIVSMTLSLAAVFIPVLFLGGVVGRLFREFSITIAAAILISGIVSLTLTPMLCRLLLRRESKEKTGRFEAASERVFQRVLGAYERGLRWTLARRGLTLAFTALVLLATGWLFVVVPKDFLPSEDTGIVFAQTEGQQGVSFESMAAHQREVARLMAADPAVLDDMASVGTGPAASANAGIVVLHLKPRADRDASADEVVNRLRPKVAGVPGIRVYLQNPPPIRIGGQLTKGLYQLTLQAQDTELLYRVSPVFEAKVRTLPGLLDVSTDLQLSNPEVALEVDRDHASTLGVTLEQVEQALASAYGTREVSTIYGAQDQYQVIVELLPELRRTPDALGLLRVRSASGALVPLDNLGRLTERVGPLTVNHTGQLPSVTLSFNLAPGVTLGDAVVRVNSTAREVLPEAVTTSLQGSAQEFASSVGGLGLLLFVAILVIYLVLGVLYESFVHPITILSALPFAGFGALVTLLVFRTPLSIYAFVGVIMLVGLVKKNGIMMVDFAIEGLKAGKTAENAICEACVVRFRPIMMTTLAALMGTLPIALGFGAGAAARRPLGLAVVGGLLFSQLITLFVTPVVFLALEGLRERGWRGLRWKRRRAATV